MKIYLNKDYGEVCAGSSKIRRVFIDQNSNRPFIEGGPEERNALAKLGMLFQDDFEEPEEVDATLENDVNALEVNAEAKSEAEAPPDSYLCKVHNRQHKKGSSAYVACWDKNLKN